MLETYEQHLIAVDKIINTGTNILFLYMLVGFGFLIIKAVRVATGEGMVFSFMGDLPVNYVTKPLIHCEYCMSSFWGNICYCLFSLKFHWIEFDIAQLLLYCVLLCGFVKYFDEKRERLVFNVTEEE